ncbi:hypothetical protein L7F22_023729 [Adiantum nelumboides]|nr:hypothetical protein [Adiantum nelumboides]
MVLAARKVSGQKVGQPALPGHAWAGVEPWAVKLQDKHVTNQAISFGVERAPHLLNISFAGRVVCKQGLPIPYKGWAHLGRCVKGLNLDVGNLPGLGLSYDNVDSAKKYEPKYQLIRNGLATKVEKSQKKMKERKNRAKKICGVKKSKVGDVQKGGKKK